GDQGGRVPRVGHAGDQGPRGDLQRRQLPGPRARGGAGAARRLRLAVQQLAASGDCPGSSPTSVVVVVVVSGTVVVVVVVDGLTCGTWSSAFGSVDAPWKSVP